MSDFVLSLVLFAISILAFQDSQDHLRRGLIALQANNAAEATQELELARNADPQNPLIWAALAQAYLKSGKKENASKAAIEAEAIAPDHPTIQHALSLYYAQSSDFLKAAELEKKFSLSKGADAEAPIRAANLYLQGGQPKEALALIQSAVDRDSSALHLNLLGRVTEAVGDPATAVPLLHQAWEKEKQNEQYCFDLAQALLRQEKFAEAKEALEIGVQNHPQNAQLQLALGVAAYGLRQFDTATQAFLRTIQIDPQIGQPYVFLGKMLDQTGSYLPQVRQAFANWNRTEPKNYLAAFLLARAMRLAGDDATQIQQLLERSIELKSDFWESHFELGQVFAKQHRFHEAANAFRRSIELNPKEAVPHYHLARIYDRLGQSEQAKAERALHEQLLEQSRNSNRTGMDTKIIENH